MFAADARDTHGSREAVDDKLGHGTVILVSEHAGGGPSRGGMCGRKGRAALKEIALTVSLEGSFTASDEFEAFADDQGVENGFVGKQASFALVWIVRAQAP